VIAKLTELYEQATQALAAHEADTAMANNAADAPLARQSAVVTTLLDSLVKMRDAAATYENLHHNLLHASPDAITIHTEDGSIIDANPMAERIFGHSRATLMRIGLHGLNPSLAADHMTLWWQRMGPGGSEVIDTHNVRADGKVISVRVRSIAFQVGEGRFIAAIARDISDETSRLRALEAGNRRFQELFSAIDKGVLIHGPDAKLLAINPSGLRILGMASSWQPGQATGNHTLVFDENLALLPDAEHPVARAVRLGEGCDNRVIGLLNQNTQRFTWISISVTPTFGEPLPTPTPTHIDAANELSVALPARFQILTIFSDITQLKRAGEFFEESQRLAGIGCWEADVQSGKVYWSDTLFHMLELAPKHELTLEEAFSFVHAADHALLAPWWQRMQFDARQIQRDIRLVTSSNKMLWIRVSGKPQLLNGKLWRVRGTCQDITRSRIEQDALMRRAEMDAETGLINRATALAQLQLKLDAYASPESKETEFDELLPGLLLIDLDRLRLLETIVGESAGAALLAASVSAVRESLPASADLVRFSDVEILVMVDVRSERELWHYADRVSQAFSRPFASGGEEFLLNPAIGVARFPSDGNRLPLLLRHLDAAAAEAKQRAGTGWQGFSAGLALKLRQRLQLEAQLRKALAQNEFSLLYQPKVNLRTGALLGVEALLRWNNEILGELSPTVFVPYAESTGDIVPIGAWALREACQQMRRWLDAGLMVPHVAVNVSFRQFLSERFTRDVSDALRDNRLPGACLELELTERVFVDDGFETQNTIADLRKLGVRIVIDDFGEGYSALGYLRRLNVHGIKISHHFMREIPHSDVDSKICRAMIMMADSLGLSVVAEGVETPAQCDFLLSLGAEVAQGFMFSAPIRANALAEFIACQHS
jgi:PAS domain S-box-containing protein